MAKSILQDKKECFLCGAKGYMDPLEAHHIFFGTANRKLSDQDGEWVWLCGCKCHRYGKQAVHQCRETDLYLKRKGQEAYEKKLGNREQFLERYGKNYL